MCRNLLFAFSMMCAAAALSDVPTTATYPRTPRDAIVDVYHGTRVADPYRWLEQLDSPATAEWVKAQNQLSQPRLEALPQRPWLKRRLTALWNYERFEVPVKAGPHYFFRRNDGTQNQSVLYVTERLGTNGRVLFDPNTVSPDATIALADFTPSPDGRVLAYALSDGGTDWQTWKFRRSDDGQDLDDTIGRTKFWGVSWARDGSGVYYSRYPARADGKGDDAGRPDVYFHKLGEPQSSDRLVYAVRNHPTRVPQGDGHRRRPLPDPHLVRWKPGERRRYPRARTPRCEANAAVLRLGRALLLRRLAKAMSFTFTPPTPRRAARVIAVNAKQPDAGRLAHRDPASRHGY